jgi:hypothetical protein
MTSMTRTAQACLLVTAALAIRPALAGGIAAGSHFTAEIDQPVCDNANKLQGYATALISKDEAAARAFAGCSSIPQGTDYIVVDPGRGDPDSPIRISKVKFAGKSGAHEGWTILVPE